MTEPSLDALLGLGGRGQNPGDHHAPWYESIDGSHGAQASPGFDGVDNAEGPERAETFDLGPPGGSPLGELRSVLVSAVGPNPYQPRRHFDQDGLDDLAASIASMGVLQPIIVRCKEGPSAHEAGAAADSTVSYELIAGERRWRAAQQAGLRHIPAIVRPAGDQTSLEEAIVENLHRADLNVLEEAAAYQQLMDEFAMTQAQVAKRVGKSRSAIANTLRLLQLPEAVQRLVVRGDVSGGHARALLAFPDPQVQGEIAGAIVRDRLSVRDVEELVRQRGRSTVRRRGGTDAGSVKPAGVLEIEDRLGDHLDTTVVVSAANGKRGRLVIEFADEQDLGRIYRLLGGEATGGEVEL